MSGRSIFRAIGAVVALFLVCTAPAAAQGTETTTESSLLTSLTDQDAEYNEDMASLTGLTAGGRRRAKPNLRMMLRRVEREWPRLLLRYAQPAVRGLLADRQSGSNSVLLNTTLFRDTPRGLHLAGGFGRNFWGEREARLNFSVRF